MALNSNYRYFSAPWYIPSRFSFIHRKYFFETGGSVSKPLAFSGMTEYYFRKRLNEEFGANPKECLTEKIKRRILQLAKVSDTTHTEIARKAYMSQIKFFKFCRKHFDCAATKLIARAQADKQSS